MLWFSLFRHARCFFSLVRGFAATFAAEQVPRTLYASEIPGEVSLNSAYYFVLLCTYVLILLHFLGEIRSTRIRLDIHTGNLCLLGCCHLCPVKLVSSVRKPRDNVVVSQHAVQGGQCSAHLFYCVACLFHPKSTAVLQHRCFPPSKSPNNILGGQLAGGFDRPLMPWGRSFSHPNTCKTLAGMMPGGLDRPLCPGERERERERD